MKTKKQKTKKNKKKNKQYHNQINKNKSKTRKHRGGASTVCPKVGFHQHIGECWNDSLMMILCYSNNICDSVQYFFNYITDIKNDTPNVPIYMIVEKIINMYDTPKHKSKYSFLCPNNIDPDNPEEFNMFKNHAIDYISNMYNRFILDQQRGDVTRPRLMYDKSMDTSLACAEANYNIANINLTAKKMYNNESHTGTQINSIITVSCINYFIITLKETSFLNIYNGEVYTQDDIYDKYRVYNDQCLTIKPTMPKEKFAVYKKSALHAMLDSINDVDKNNFSLDDMK